MTNCDQNVFEVGCKSLQYQGTMFCLPQSFKDLSLLARNTQLRSNLLFTFDTLLSRFQQVRLKKIVPLLSGSQAF